MLHLFLLIVSFGALCIVGSIEQAILTAIFCILLFLNIKQTVYGTMENRILEAKLEIISTLSEKEYDLTDDDTEDE